ncbi:MULTISPECIES: hypothetical protein [unclassified Pseudoalteromonas]|uniref:hypothetical protein n=1 Tax=unclassified Pseudoalteromonas TaxID=194690 RepID=UPI000CF6601D|nr:MULTISPECIES: hypothetical protein [unclassified Pseudoalteromonas]
MILSKGTKSSIWLGALTFLLFVFMLYFRAYIYAGMYIEPDAPYGISDIIEFLLGCLFLLLMAASVILAVALFIKGSVQSKKSGALLVVFCVVLFIAYSPLHNMAARLGG